MRQGMTPEEAFRSYAAAGGHDTSVPADGGLSDAQAAEIFAKLQAQQSRRTYAAKKNWTSDELHLLVWDEI